jgi:hypothetical protein
MDTQRQLDKLLTMLSLFGLASGFFLLSILILSKGDSEGASIAGGFISVLLGTAFLLSAFSYWRAARYLMPRGRPQLHDEGRLADGSAERVNT